MSATTLTWGVSLCMGASIVLGPLVGDSGSFHYAQLVLCAVFVAAWVLDPQRLAAPISSAAWKAFALSALVWLEAVSLSRFAAFQITAIDFSIFDWMIENGVRGRFGYSPVYEVNHLGIHSSFIFLVLVPLRAFVRSPLLLLMVGPLILWLGLFPLRRLVERAVGGHGGALLAASLALVASTYLGRLASEGFRIESLVPPALLWFLAGWGEQRRGLWVTAALVLFLTKEDTMLTLGSFAVAAALLDRPRRAEALVLLAVCVGWLGLYTQVIQPALRPGLVGYLGFWQGFGQTPGGVLLGMATHPGLVLERLLTSGLLGFSATLLFLPWLSWRAAAGLAPTAFLLGTADYEVMHDFRSYYPTPLLAFALFGVLEVLRTRKSPRWMAAGLVAFLLFPVVGMGYARVCAFSPSMLQEIAQVRRAIASAPRVCGQTVLYPHLGYPADLAPLMELSCADQPGTWVVVSTVLDPSPFDGATLRKAIDEWRSTRQVTEVGAFVIVGPPEKTRH